MREKSIENIKTLLVLSSDVKKTIIPYANENLMFKNEKIKMMEVFKPNRIILKDITEDIDNSISTILHVNISLTEGGTYNKDIPNTVTELVGNLNAIPADKIPPSIQKISFIGKKYNMHFGTILFKNLVHLKISLLNGGAINLDNLPRSIEKLELVCYFDNNVKGEKLPNQLKYLTFGLFFNSEWVNLPDTITHLTFGNTYDKRCDIFPKSLTHLSFGKSFNQEIMLLAPGLIDLRFGEKFNHKICHILPPSLKRLDLGAKYDIDIQKLPDTLEILIIGTFESKITVNIGNVPLIVNYHSNYSHTFRLLPTTIRFAILPQESTVLLRLKQPSSAIFYIVSKCSSVLGRLNNEQNSKPLEMKYVHRTNASCFF
ncbi:hypothetical protein EON71_00505 [bacterium]|nr:MAG: hypothetical protein EON71_00505 [bacterium]